MACTIGRFQPGIFLWGRAHGEALSKITADGKYLPSTPDCRRGSILVTTLRFSAFFHRNTEYFVSSFILDIAWQQVYENLVVM